MLNFKNLSAGRNLGRAAELGDGIMKIFVGSHIVFYLEGENSIDIVRILHQAMDVGSRLKP